MEQENRFPDLGKLSLAILEALVEPIIGKDAINVVKKPVEEKKLRDELMGVLLETEKRFTDESDDKDLRKGILQLPIGDLPSIQNEIRSFYEKPSSPSFKRALKDKLISDYPFISTNKIEEAVENYIVILHEELTSISEEIRQKLQTLSVLSIDQNIKKILKAIPNSKNDSSISISITGSAPPLPQLVVGRDNDVDSLKKRLFTNSGGEDNQSNAQTLTTIRGWPGVGKTTIAAVLAHDNDIIRVFSDGVLWVSLGTNPDPFSNLGAWGRDLHISNIIESKTTEEASVRLASVLRTKRMLLVIDDVWDINHAKPFLIGGKSCATLITTRSNEVAQALASGANSIYKLSVLNEESSLELLKKLTPSVVSSFPNEARKLVSELEGLPLALQVAGHLLNTEVNYGFSVVDLLKELRDGTKILKSKAPADRTELESETIPTVAVLLGKSTDRLDDYTRECFAFLGVFAPKPATFDIEALQKIWETDDPKPIIRKLIDRGLLDPFPETSRFQLHSLMVSHAKSLLK